MTATWLPYLRQLPLVVLLTFSTACTRTQLVPVLVPHQPCSLPVLEPFPHTSASESGPDTVSMPRSDVTAIWLWVREAQRWMAKAAVCLTDGVAP